MKSYQLDIKRYIYRNAQRLSILFLFVLTIGIMSSLRIGVYADLIPIPATPPVTSPISITPIPTVTPNPYRSIRITSPNGGELLTVGQVYKITWESNKIDKVSIGYKSCSSCLDWIVNNIPNNKFYDWKVNVGNTTNTKFKIWIIGYETGKGSVTDESDADFTVVKPLPIPTVTIIIPTATPTMTPTPTIDPNRKPVITTAILPWARVNRNYQAMISGYDLDVKDSLNMRITNLPKGILQGPCMQVVINGRKNISCNISGTPQKIGLYLVFVTLEDNRGGKIQRWLPLFVFPK